MNHTGIVPRLTGGLGISYHFGGEPLTEGHNNLEDLILNSVSRNQTGLKLFRTEGLFRGYHGMESHFVYRLKSEHAYADCVFSRDKDGELVCDILMLLVPISRQGQGHKLKKFVLKELALTLFDVGVARLVGMASPNDHAVLRKPNRRDWRREKTKDGTPKLIRLYALFGARREGKHDVILTREDYQSFNQRLTGSGSLIGQSQGTAGA
jgi:hypothetical protein